MIFVKVDCDKVPNLAKRLRVMAMPTFVFMREGAQVGKLMGASEDKLREALDKGGNYNGACCVCFRTRYSLFKERRKVGGNAGSRRKEGPRGEKEDWQT